MPVTESGGCCGETNEHRHQHDPSENCGMCSIESGDILLSASDVFVADFSRVLAGDYDLQLLIFDSLHLYP